MIINILFLGQRPAKRVSHNGQGWGIGKGMVKPLFFTANIGKNTLFVGSRGGVTIYIYIYVYIYMSIFSTITHQQNNQATPASPICLGDCRDALTSQ